MGNTHSAKYPAVPESIPVARAALTSLAAAGGACAAQVDAVRLATSEVLTNVVLHAYHDDPGEIQVTAASVSDELWILISDDGRGLHARNRSPGLGLGLMLVSRVADDFSIVPRGSGGTEVRIRFNLAPDAVADGQARGSRAAASRPASARFSTTT